MPYKELEQFWDKKLGIPVQIKFKKIPETTGKGKDAKRAAIVEVPERHLAEAKEQITKTYTKKQRKFPLGIRMIIYPTPKKAFGKEAILKTKKAIQSQYGFAKAFQFPTSKYKTSHHGLVNIFSRFPNKPTYKTMYDLLMAQRSRKHQKPLFIAVAEISEAVYFLWSNIVADEARGMVEMFIVPLAREMYRQRYVDYYTTASFRVETANAKWDRKNRIGYVENKEINDPDNMAAIFGFDKMNEEQEAKE